MRLKTFWVKYVYMPGIWLQDYYAFNKVLPGKWEEHEMPLGPYPEPKQWKAAYKTVRCESKDQLIEILFDYELKRVGRKCYIYVLRYVEIKYENFQPLHTIFEVDYELVITREFPRIPRGVKFRRGSIRPKPKSHFLLALAWKMFQLGHTGLIDKEVVVFKDPSELTDSNIYLKLLNKLPPAPDGTKIEIRKYVRRDAV